MRKQMGRFLTVLLLMVTLVFGLLSVDTVSAATNQWTTKIDKTTYEPGEAIAYSITFDGLFMGTGQYHTLLIAKVDDYRSYVSNNFSKPLAYVDKYTLSSYGYNATAYAPGVPGAYVIFFETEKPIHFTVSSKSDTYADMTWDTSKTVYEVGDIITVQVKNVTSRMIKNNAGIYFSAPGAHYNSGSFPNSGPYVNAKSANDTLSLEVKRVGNFELCFDSGFEFSNGSPATLVKSFAFTAVEKGKGPATTPVVTTPVVTTPVVTTPTTTTTQSESISVGAKFAWPRQTGGLGWRLYRSETSGIQGISVTDFYITSTDFIDVNVDANMTYYYVLRQVLAEANPMQGIAEKLGPASSEMVVRTGSTILGGNASAVKGEKQFILMTLDDPLMTVNGTSMEVDPGRGTTPIVLNSRTLAPIRAIVENMGGSIGWDAPSNTATINYNNRTVKMIIDQKYMLVDGARQNIDVAPRSINQRTMLPVRFISDALGISIDYLNSTKQIVIVYIAL